MVTVFDFEQLVARVSKLERTLETESQVDLPCTSLPGERRHLGKDTFWRDIWETTFEEPTLETASSSNRSCCSSPVSNSHYRSSRQISGDSDFQADLAESRWKVLEDLIQHEHEARNEDTKKLESMIHEGQTEILEECKIMREDVHELAKLASRSVPSAASDATEPKGSEEAFELILDQIRSEIRQQLDDSTEQLRGWVQETVTTSNAKNSFMTGIPQSPPQSPQLEPRAVKQLDETSKEQARMVHGHSLPTWRLGETSRSCSYMSFANSKWTFVNGRWWEEVSQPSASNCLSSLQKFAGKVTAFEPVLQLRTVSEPSAEKPPSSLQPLPTSRSGARAGEVSPCRTSRSSLYRSL